MESSTVNVWLLGYQVRSAVPADPCFKIALPVTDLLVDGRIIPTAASRQQKGCKHTKHDESANFPVHREPGDHNRSFWPFSPV